MLAAVSRCAEVLLKTHSFVDLRCPDFSSRCSANWPHGPLEMSLLKNVEKAASSCHHLHATLLACTLTPSHPRNENTITAKEIK